MKLKSSPDEKSPITGKFTVIVDKDPATGLTSKLCLETGFTTNSFMIEGSKTVEDLKTQLPKVAVEAMITDAFGMVWIPMMQNTNTAAIFPFGMEGTEGFVWSVCPIKKMTEDQRKDYPNPNNPGEYYDSYVDTKNSSYFEFGDFEKAFDLFAELSGLETPQA